MTIVEATAKHRTAEAPPAAERRSVLVAAFPKSLAIELPPAGTPIGRGWFAEHGLVDSEMSQRHVVVEGTRGCRSITDTGSSNGTYLDGEFLAHDEASPLEDGAVLRLGSTMFVYREEMSGSLTASPPQGDLVSPYGLRPVMKAIEQLPSEHTRPLTVLVDGETGSGKELAARAVAEALGATQPYGAINITSMPPGMFDKQLFGHVAGAFSDARQGAVGVLESHSGGAVLLDEIGELPLDLQPKLLRALENREVLPLGASKPRRIDVLIVAATNRDLETMIEDGTFRPDLFARLSRWRITLPPLRDRAEDIYSIVEAMGSFQGQPLEASRVEVEAVERLMLAPWPRNVRQLFDVVTKVTAVDPKPGLRAWAVEQVLGPLPPLPGRGLTRAKAQSALLACDNNVTRAAKRLGVSRSKLRRLLGREPKKS